MTGGHVEDARLLAWLKQPTATRSEEDGDTAILRNALTRGHRAKPADDDLVRLLLPAGRKATRDDWELARHWTWGWRNLGYGVTDVKPWLDAGAAPDEGPLVGRLVAEGITPSRVGRPGEAQSATPFTTILEVARSVEYGESLSDALDAAGVERTKQAHPGDLYWRAIRARKRTGTEA